MVATAFISMMAALVSLALGCWIKLGGALKTPGLGKGVDEKSLGRVELSGGTKGG